MSQMLDWLMTTCVWWCQVWRIVFISNRWHESKDIVIEMYIIINFFVCHIITTILFIFSPQSFFKTCQMLRSSSNFITRRYSFQPNLLKRSPKLRPYSELNWSFTQSQHAMNDAHNLSFCPLNSHKVCRVRCTVVVKGLKNCTIFCFLECYFTWQGMTLTEIHLINLHNLELI